MEEKELLQGIAIHLQKKYNGFNEIGIITKQLQDALRYDDTVTIRMLIRMRQEEMDTVDSVDVELNALLAQLTQMQKKALKNGDTLHFSGENAAMVQKIAEIEEKNKRLLAQLIEQDKLVNCKLAGEESYYEK